MTKREKQKSGILFIGTIVNSFVEILGLAAVVPVIGLVIEPELIRTNEYLATAFEWTSAVGIDTERKFLMLTSVLLVAAFLFKALFNLGLNLFQTRFSLGIGHRISGLMWQYHFAQSLEKMRSQQSGRVLAEINVWPGLLADKFIVGGMRMINEVTVIVLIGFGLLAYEPIVLVSVIVLLAAGATIIRKATKKRLNTYSEVEKALGPQTNTVINNAIRGFLEVITFRASESVLKDFLRKKLVLISLTSKAQIMNMAPAKLYEVLAVTAVSASIFISLLLGNSNEQFLNLLILMALSAYRVMPSMSRINGQIMAMRKTKHVLEVIESALVDLNALHAQPTIQSVQLNGPNIRIDNATIGYESLNMPVLDSFSAYFPSRSINAIVGPSGSGKSTLVNTILGLHRPDCGHVEVSEDQLDWLRINEQLSVSNWLEHIGYLSQQPYLFNGTVSDNLTMMIPGETPNDKAIKELISRLELTDCLGEDPLDFKLLEGGNNLSGGQQQRLAILRALRVHRPVLILDEATSALDGAKRDAVFQLLRERANGGTNVILITHDLELAQQCDTVLDLADTKKNKLQQKKVPES